MASYTPLEQTTALDDGRILRIEWDELYIPATWNDPPEYDSKNWRYYLDDEEVDFSMLPDFVQEDLDKYSSHGTIREVE